MKKVKLTEKQLEAMVLKVLEEQLKDGFNKGMHDAVKDKPDCSKIKPNEILGGIVKVVKGNKKLYPKHTSGVDKLEFLGAVSKAATGQLEDDIYYIEVKGKPFCKLR